jgi:hypothetical protein
VRLIWSLVAAALFELLSFSSGSSGAMPRRLETIANLSMIVASVLMGATLVKNHLWPQRGHAQEGLRPGTRLDLPGPHSSPGRRSLVLVLQSQCRFCTESGPFYRNVVKVAGERGIHLIAALPQPVAEARRYLRSLDLAIEDVRRIPPDVLGVRGTPTLIAIDRRGVVEQVWRGRVDTAGEVAVLASLQSD